MQITYQKSFSYTKLTKLKWFTISKERKVTQPSRLCSNNANANKNYSQLNLMDPSTEGIFSCKISFGT